MKVYHLISFLSYISITLTSHVQTSYELIDAERHNLESLFFVLQINQISYFWFMEYWGFIRFYLVLWRKIRLLIIIALCIILRSLDTYFSRIVFFIGVFSIDKLLEHLFQRFSNLE